MEPKCVVLMSYDPNTKQHERYDALVIGSREMPEHSKPVLNLVHFRHNDISAHHSLMGVDWADTMSRTLDVPHQDDLGNQSFYWVETQEGSLMKALAHYDRASEMWQADNAELRKQNLLLKAKVAATPEERTAVMHEAGLTEYSETGNASNEASSTAGDGLGRSGTLQGGAAGSVQESIEPTS